ncbi:carboxypeptidase regulatory-like domain-containing protein [Halalkalibacter sp. APA_J-10(15)]|uniref:carboxypeptidase regulatory-like domain-containing protein n=1 Tax=Halalkalibacter sp. APA_J-10(15) TaxID=2933805 RepID=UPI001FF22DB0|nr:carboxypeptidase regulatory-like domain-containing protein [Halalkalibacter sp. APA_J-10(15)]MCK0472800.1 carboxypeptidase regulatory-like domain-containing protein [Halalkalibacter sp. APA_J-10(15)]
MSTKVLGKIPGLMFLCVVLLPLIMLLLLLNPTTSYGNETGTNFYVDATNGNDDNNGLTEESAWQTLDQVNGFAFEPGDKILFKSGERWEGQLAPQGSGVEGAPIIIDKYGEGDLPLIEGEGEVDATVKLKNQEYWEISHLEITNTAPIETTLGESLGDYRGIYVTGSDAGTLHHIHINGVHIHDVSGEVNWIRGSGTSDPGFNFNTGWDRSKRSGGIVFDTWVEDVENPQPTQFEGVIIENSLLEDNSFTSISIKQYVGNDSGNPYTGWGSRDSVYGEPDFTPHKDVTIRNNYISHYGSDFAANGMYVTGVQGSVIENNVIAGAGTSGIEIYYADDVIVQYNEVFDTRRKAGGADHNGIGPDRATTNIIVQYNYIYNTGDGILICQFSYGDVIIRHNIIENVERYPIYLHSDRSAVADVYNNTVYQDNGSNFLVYGYGSYVEATYNIKNNILYSTNPNAVITTGGGVNYENNSYFGSDFAIPGDDSGPITIDPLMVNPGPFERITTPETGTNLHLLERYRLQSGSSLIDAGLDLYNDGTDFFGNDLYNDKADIGAIEYYGDPESQYESITGTVYDSYENRLSGVTVSLDVDGEEYSTETDENGFYSIRNIPIGTYNVTASRDEYESHEITVELTALNTAANKNITIMSNSDYGSVKGLVFDHRGQPVENANVSVIYDGEELFQTLTNESGEYVIKNISLGDNYTIRAMKDNYGSDEATGIRVLPGYETPVPNLFVEGTHPEYLEIDDFNHNETGSLPSGWDSILSGGSIEVVETPSQNDKSVKFTRDTNSGRTQLSKYYDEGEVTGIVTVELDVMRDDEIFSGNSWISIPYIYGYDKPSSQPGVAIAMNKGDFIAYDGGVSRTIMPYEQGEWYNLKIVMNMNTQTYDLYINGEQIFDSVAFRNQMDEVGHIEVHASSSNYGSAHINNLRVINGTPYAKDDNILESLSMTQGSLSYSGGLYSTTLPYSVDEINLTPETFSIFSTITINGEIVESGVESHPISIDEGDNVISLVVMAEDGSEREYEIRIHRMTAAIESRLDSISVSEGELSPEFYMDTLEYSLEVPHEVDSIDIEAVALSPQTLISINGSELMLAEAMNEVPLEIGENRIRIWVESGDGTADNEYIIIVTREQGEVPEVDVTELEGLIDKARAVTNEDGRYTEATYEALQAAIEKAQEEVTSIETEEELQEALIALQTAIDGLEEKAPEVPEVDVTELEELIDKARAVTNEDGRYTEATYEALQAAIEKAQEEVTSIETEEELQEALTALQTAIDGLEEKAPEVPEVDVTELEELIDKARAITNEDGRYTEATYEALQAAIEKAQEEVTSIETEEELQEALIALQTAIDGLEEVQSQKEEEKDLSNGNENDQDHSKGEKEDKLPETATANYTFLLFGSLFVVLGFILYFLSQRKFAVK